MKEFDGNAQICVTPNGWIDDSSFLLSMRIFLHQLCQHRPFEQHGWFLLCLDGHGSHTQLQVAKGHEHNELLVFPPHCSHIVQPLDLSCFSILKKGIEKAFSDVLSASRFIMRSDTPAMIKPHWQAALHRTVSKGLLGLQASHLCLV